jgi:Fic family protein
MILSELVGGNEADPAYQALEIENGSRQYDFIRSIVTASLAVKRPLLSSTVIKSLNFHAITCLHTNAGEYRPCPVRVGKYSPPEHYRVEALMNDMINVANWGWDRADPVALATYVLWRLNWVHPFINGNGRTARAASYFVLCMKAGGWLRGKTILPELIRRERASYVDALKRADESYARGAADLSALHELVSRLLKEQLDGDPPPTPDPAAAPAQPA